MNWVSISALIVDAIIIIAFFAFTYFGYRRGLTRVIFKVLTFILSILIVFVIYKPVTSFVIEHTKIDDWLNTKITEKLSNTEIADGKEIDEESTNISKSVVSFINSLVKESVSKAKESTISYVAEKLSIIVVEIITIIMLLVVTHILLGFIKVIASWLTKLPFLKTIDGIGGLVYGAIKGIIVIYLVLAIISILSPLLVNTRIIKSINDSKIGSGLYNNNVILNLIK